MPIAATCYMCDSLATTREHAPPFCFFPPHHRRNLITVPSCDAHNSKKSKDDEYMRLAISMSHGTNEEGHTTAFEKALRGLKRSPHLFREFFLKGPLYPAVIDGQPSMAYTIDHARLTGTLDHLARAIFFNHFSIKWSEQLHILLASAFFSPNEPNYQQQNARLQFLKDGKFDEPKYGENQDIFYYQLMLDDPISNSILKMVFYKGFAIFAYPMSRATSTPIHADHIDQV